MIAILVAVRQELHPILRRAQARHVVRQQHLDFYEGTLAGQPVALLALGIGQECARIAAETTIRCYRPDLIISAGFGGGLVEHVADGDIVVGTDILELLEKDGDEVRWRLQYHANGMPRFCVKDHDLRVHYGKIITAEEMILKACQKERIGQQTGAISVDMETSAVAAVALAHETDFLAFRCITDHNHEDLPDPFNDFFVLGQLRARRVVATCLRSPRVLADLARLGLRARTSGQNLARFIELALFQIRLPALATRSL